LTNSQTSILPSTRRLCSTACSVIEIHANLKNHALIESICIPPWVAVLGRSSLECACGRMEKELRQGFRENIDPYTVTTEGGPRLTCIEALSLGFSSENWLCIMKSVNFISGSAFVVRSDPYQLTTRIGASASSGTG
jgi:hypothetical protein